MKGKSKFSARLLAALLGFAKERLTGFGLRMATAGRLAWDWRAAHRQHTCLPQIMIDLGSDSVLLI